MNSSKLDTCTHKMRVIFVNLGVKFVLVVKTIVSIFVVLFQVGKWHNLVWKWQVGVIKYSVDYESSAVLGDVI